MVPDRRLSRTGNRSLASVPAEFPNDQDWRLSGLQRETGAWAPQARGFCPATGIAFRI